MDIEFKAFVSE